MSHARILSKMEPTTKTSLTKDEKSKKGRDFLKQALILLNGTHFINDLLKQRPTLLNPLLLELPPNSKKSNLDLLIDQSEWLLKTAIEYGNEDATVFLKALTEKKIIPDKLEIESRKLLSLNEADEEQGMLIDDIRISENYFKY